LLTDYVRTSHGALVRANFIDIKYCMLYELGAAPNCMDVKPLLDLGSLTVVPFIKVRYCLLLASIRGLDVTMSLLAPTK